MLKLAYGAAALVLLASPAVAQTAQPDWSGPYIGIFGGYNQAKDDGDETLLFDRNFDGSFSESVVTSGGANAFSPGFCDGASRTSTAADGCTDDRGGVEFGARAGWDWQFGNIVVGGLAEYSVGDVKDAVTGFSTTPANYTFTRDLESVAAARLRLGYAMDRALIYATGGYAHGQFENRFRSSNVANTFTETVENDSGEGWQAGAGMEYQLAGGLTLTGEYLYTSLDAESPVIRVGPGTAPATNPFILPPNTAGTDMIRSSDSFDVHQIRLGMAYRF